MESNTIGWVVSYRLTEEIDCEDKNHDRENIKFLTTRYKSTKDKKGQLQITGFELTIHISNNDNAMTEADNKAHRLTNLLSASSGTYTKFFISGYSEIKKSGKHVVGWYLTARYSIRNKVMLNITDEKFTGIIEDKNNKLNEKLSYIRQARQAEHCSDYDSVIKFLVLATGSQDTGKYGKYVYLRHALSHSDEPLLPKTKKKLEELFGIDYFEFLSNDKYDNNSLVNQNKIKQHAKEFLKLVHEEIKIELEK